MSYILINGNPVDGFCFTGPFEDHERAVLWTEECGLEKPWWVQELENPVMDEAGYANAEIALTEEDLERARLYALTGDDRLR